MSDEVSLRLTQVADLSWMMQQERGLLLHDPGVGKTPPVCVYIFWRWSAHQEGTVWIMPKSLLKKNREELLRFTDLNPNEVVIVDGTAKQRAEQLATPAVCYLMGPKRFEDEWQLLKQRWPYLNVVIVDESQLAYINWDSKRTQALVEAMKGHYRYFFAMTGTIIKGKLSTAFPVIHIIEPRYYGTPGGFLMHHAVRDGWGTVVGWQNHEKLSRIFKTHGIRRTFKDEYGEEAKVIQVADVEMDDVHREVYKEWHDKAMLELEGEFLNAPNAAVHALRARQILSHPETFLIPKMAGRTTARDERLITELEDIKYSGERYVLFSCFIPEIERLKKIAEKVGLRAGMLHGGITGKARGDTELAFREGKLDFLSVNPDVAGIGYNWPFLQRVGFTSLGYGDDSFFQAYRRGIRGIRETALLINLFGYRNTVDWRIRAVIESKSIEANKVDPSVEILHLNPRGGATI